MKILKEKLIQYWINVMEIAQQPAAYAPQNNYSVLYNERSIW